MREPIKIAKLRFCVGKKRSLESLWLIATMTQGGVLLEKVYVAKTSDGEQHMFSIKY